MSKLYVEPSVVLKSATTLIQSSPSRSSRVKPLAKESVVNTVSPLTAPETVKFDSAKASPSASVTVVPFIELAMVTSSGIFSTATSTVLISDGAVEVPIDWVARKEKLREPAKLESLALISRMTP